VDIITIGFVNTFIAQSNGWPGENFGNGCWGPPDYPYYNAPGYGGKDNDTNDRLPTRCPWVAEGIPVCQSLGKKVILSLGGAWLTPKEGGTYPAYSLTGTTDGEAFAEFLWGAYGPYQKSWTDAGNPRPLDGGDTGLHGNHIDIDGFDFDIELPSSGNYPWIGIELKLTL
jgi:chitinase